MQLKIVRTVRYLWRCLRLTNNISTRTTIQDHTDFFISCHKYSYIYLRKNQTKLNDEQVVTQISNYAININTMQVCNHFFTPATIINMS